MKVCSEWKSGATVWPRTLHLAIFAEGDLEWMDLVTVKLKAELLQVGIFYRQIYRQNKERNGILK